MHLHTKFETRSEVKLQGHRDPIMVPDTLSSQDASTHQFEIPTSNNIRNMLRTRLLKKARSEVNGHHDL